MAVQPTRSIGVQQLNSRTSFESFLRDNRESVIYFYSGTVLPSVSPLFEQFAEKRDDSGIAFGEADIKKLETEIEKWNIDKTPVFIAFHNGEESCRYHGTDARELRQFIGEWLQGIESKAGKQIQQHEEKDGKQYSGTKPHDWDHRGIEQQQGGRFGKESQKEGLEGGKWSQQQVYQQGQQQEYQQGRQQEYQQGQQQEYQQGQQQEYQQGQQQYEKPSETLGLQEGQQHGGYQRGISEQQHIGGDQFHRQQQLQQGGATKGYGDDFQKEQFGERQGTEKGKESWSEKFDLQGRKEEGKQEGNWQPAQDTSRQHQFQGDEQQAMQGEGQQFEELSEQIGAKRPCSIAEFDQLLQENKQVIAYFYRETVLASIAPTFEKFAERHMSEGVAFVEIDIAKLQGIEGKWNVNETPMFIAFREGQEAKRCRCTDRLCLQEFLEGWGGSESFQQQKKL